MIRIATANFSRKRATIFDTILISDICSKSLQCCLFDFLYDFCETDEVKVESDAGERR